MKNLLTSRQFFKGLFWKIFFAIWITNILILFAVSFAIIGKIEQARFSELLEQSILQYATIIIERHENGYGADYKRHKDPSKGFNKPIARRRPPMSVDTLTITDAAGNVIFDRTKPSYQAKVNDPLAMRLQTIGANGQEYQIATVRPEPPQFIKEIAHRFKSLRLLMILLATTIASALLSWGIAKPLKQLTRYNQQFAGGKEPIDIPSTLLGRADEIGELAREFQTMTRQVNTTIDNQKQLLHDVSHELRAPLARLQTAVALQEQLADNDQYSDIIHRELDRMNSLIQCILDFSRLNQSNDTKEEFELKALLDECIASANISYPDRIFKLNPDDTSFTLHGYPEALGSAIDNFIDNACKYSPADSTIEIHISQENSAYRITIRDHGLGVPNAEIEKIGTPFYRASNSSPADGFGLGLSIARKAVEKHKGIVGFQNHINGGLLVTIHLPI